jgi:hypothetical protein
MRIPTRLRRLADERGTTVLELAITMLILGMVGALLMNSLSISSEAASHVDDQNRGLADLQVVTERMSRDLRVARGVDAGATTSQLTIWIDADSDYVRDTDENITWRIKCRTGVNCGTDERQYDVERVTGPVATGAVQIVGQSLVSDIAFAYTINGAPTLTPQNATAVKVSMEYDAIIDAYAQKNTVDFEVRLRNVQ